MFMCFGEIAFPWGVEGELLRGFSKPAEFDSTHGKTSESELISCLATDAIGNQIAISFGTAEAGRSEQGLRALSDIYS